MSDSLLSPPFLFRFEAPLPYRKEIWPISTPWDEECRLPTFPGEPGETAFADLRGAWNENGVTFSLQVDGKKKAPLRRDAFFEASDGLQLWIDTRATLNVHRASHFCHRLLFLPPEGKEKTGLASALRINRAKAAPKPPPANTLQATGQSTKRGYTLYAHIRAAALQGFDPEEHPRWGFFYAVNDAELGRQTWSIGSEFPYEEDPSVWGLLELVQE
ncbi:DOMON domain-containing protein [Lignipirellula cremea]|uniref:Carbohydrate-binding domain-containing protein n=1 Tax=Lignipirellula cremea TaxID=2528010 RepID=A0A518DR44_9BACT|nr:hypothetical protein [Lignipirellula cremea]QDU94292.1 hypothetical protein Pla8534_20810 [Lignipirellula cremea]